MTGHSSYISAISAYISDWESFDQAIFVSVSHLRIFCGCSVSVNRMQLCQKVLEACLWGQQCMECRNPQANKDLGLCCMFTLESWYIIHRWVQPYKSIHFYKAEDLCFPKIYTFMGFCPVIFWYIAGNDVQLYATPNLRYWPWGVLHQIYALGPKGLMSSTGFFGH